MDGNQNNTENNIDELEKNIEDIIEFEENDFSGEKDNTEDDIEADVEEFDESDDEEPETLEDNKRIGTFIKNKLHAVKEILSNIKLWQLCLLIFFITYFIATPVCIVIATINNVNIIDFDEDKDVGDVFEYSDGTINNGNVKEVNEEDVEWFKLQSTNKYNENIINILLIGADQKKSDDGNGNSDSMMIVSLDTEKETIKLVSFLRDSYLQIPDHRPNKLNASYLMGGPSLVKSTIEQNFCVSIDGIVIIYFDTFPDIIDSLGGVDVPINDGEASFINLKTKYKYESLTAGTHHLNGDQTLWFSRIRYKSSDIFGQMDMGRTARQRYVVNELYKKYKDQDITSLIQITNQILQYIKVDEELLDRIVPIVKVASSFELDELQSYQCPADGQYEFCDVKLSNGKKMEAIGIDKYMDEIRDDLHMYLYGDTDY